MCCTKSELMRLCVNLIIIGLVAWLIQLSQGCSRGLPGVSAGNEHQGFIHEVLPVDKSACFLYHWRMQGWRSTETILVSRDYRKNFYECCNNHNSPVEICNIFDVLQQNLTQIALKYYQNGTVESLGMTIEQQRLNVQHIKHTSEQIVRGLLG